MASSPLSYISTSVLTLQNNLQTTTNQLSRTYERLSSGLRISSPADDAAGLALATRTKSDERLSDVALRNLNDGISMISIAESALNEQSDILIRLEELSARAENGTLSAGQQQASNDEYRALVTELGRIGSTATWNSMGASDTYLLAARRGTNVSSATIQAGIDSTAASGIIVNFFDTATLSGVINRDDLAAAALGTDASTSTLASSYNDLLLGFTANDSNGVLRHLLAGVSVSGTTVTFELFRQGSAAETPPADPSNWQLLGTQSLTYNASTGVFDESTLATTYSGFSDGGSVQFSLDLRGLRMSSLTEVDAPDLGDTSALEMSGIETATRASKAAAIIDAKQEDVEAALGSIAGTQAALEQAFTYMTVERENYGAAYDRITSIDVAEEAANMTALQIRQSGAIASLASANQQPTTVLKLLGWMLGSKAA